MSKLILFPRLITDVQKFGRHPGLSNFVTTTIKLLIGKLVHNDTALQVNGLPKLMTSTNGFLEATPAFSGLPASWDQGRL